MDVQASDNSAIHAGFVSHRMCSKIGNYLDHSMKFILPVTCTWVGVHILWIILVKVTVYSHKTDPPLPVCMLG